MKSRRRSRQKIILVLYMIADKDAGQETVQCPSSHHTMRETNWCGDGCLRQSLLKYSPVEEPRKGSVSHKARPQTPKQNVCPAHFPFIAQTVEE